MLIKKNITFSLEIKGKVTKIIEEGHKFYINSAINLFCCRIYIIFAPKKQRT